MLYFVTCDELTATGKPQAWGIDPGLSLADAIDHARELLIQKRQNATIRVVGGDRTITGDDSLAVMATKH
jgi:hypothetical protein